MAPTISAHRSRHTQRASAALARLPLPITNAGFAMQTLILQKDA
jgi:hypothetical protein